MAVRTQLAFILAIVIFMIIVAVHPLSSQPVECYSLNKSGYVVDKCHPRQ